MIGYWGRRVFGPKRDEVTGEWRKLHNEKLRMREGRGVYSVLLGNPEGKRPLGRPRRRWEANIKMDLQEVGGGCGDWMELDHDRERWRTLVCTVKNFRVP
jgi:hypothetical protein